MGYEGTMKHPSGTTSASSLPATKLAFDRRSMRGWSQARISFLLLVAGTGLCAENERCVSTGRWLSMDLGDASHRSLKSSLDSHRNGHQAQLRELDLKSLPYLTLPRPPVRCEQLERTAPNDVFEIRDAKWRLRSVEKLPAAKRPDPAFRRIYPIASAF